MFSRTFNPALHMVHSVHEYYHTNRMVKPEGNNNMMQPSPVWAQGPYPVMVGLGEAWCCQSEADHSLPLLTHLNHCLLRQEGRPLYNIIIICCCCSMSVTRLRLWQGGVCVFPDGQVSKSGDKLKPNAWRSRAQPRKPLLLWAVYLSSLTHPLLLEKNSGLFNPSIN